MCEILSNIMNYPDNPVYTSINGSNSTLYNKIFNIQVEVEVEVSMNTISTANTTHNTSQLRSTCICMLCLLCCGFSISHVYMSDLLKYQQKPELLRAHSDSNSNIVDVDTTSSSSGSSSSSGTNSSKNNISLLSLISNVTITDTNPTTNTNNIPILSTHTYLEHITYYILTYQHEPDPESDLDGWTSWYEHLNKCNDLLSS